MARQKVPDAELDVLACLHRLKKATAREIREALIPYRSMAHGSVLTLLKRLQAKSLVSKEKGPVGKAFVYRRTHRAEPIYGNILRDLVRRIFAGDSIALVASLFEGKPPDPSELESLQQLLNDLRDKSARTGRKQ